MHRISVSSEVVTVSSFSSGFANAFVPLKNS
jgi:hypothetical protein